MGIGAIGGMLDESFEQIGIGTNGVFTRVASSAVSDAATDRYCQVSTVVPALGHFTGVDFVVILGSTDELRSLRISGDVARVARAAGALVFAMLAQPSSPTGGSVKGVVAEIADCTDALIFVPSQPHVSLLQHLLDAHIAAAFAGVSNSSRPRAPVGADFLDVRRTFIDAGEASIGIGSATGRDRARHAAEMAIVDAESSPIDTAAGVAILVAGGCSLRLREVETAVCAVREVASPNTTVTLGVHCDERLGETVQVTLIVAEHARVQVPLSPSNPDVSWLHVVSSLSSNNL
ncbi:hypothetical protein [Paraburkholderia sp. BL21I4N1]|uniref:hypothetical protein n=1 Tax=Paraburkholderia sp. BL21I4N1 TaxID=1938801 RepID=UPI0015E4895C|nr:hypothetical protein [Paraburkholderia sp. BL21I4N1]